LIFTSGGRKHKIEWEKNENYHMEKLKRTIWALADVYSSILKNKIEERKEVMKADDNSHYLIYRVLGISNEEGAEIDVYQNTGRFLYKLCRSFS
jgi:hypothetical protein